MWIYEVSTGWLSHDGVQVAKGYSGAPGFIDNPSDEDLKNQGPIPEGLYTIGDEFDSTSHGPFCLPLIPDPSNLMYDRGGFLIHGDNIHTPGTASEGCVIMPPNVRHMISGSGDMRFQVVNKVSLSG